MDEFMSQIYNILFNLYPLKIVKFYESAKLYFDSTYDIDDNYLELRVYHPNIEEFKRILITAVVDEYTKFYMIKNNLSRSITEKIINILYQSGCHRMDFNYNAIPKLCLKFLETYPKLIISSTTWFDILNDIYLDSICKPEENYDSRDSDNNRLIHVNDINVYKLAIKYGAVPHKETEDERSPLDYPIQYIIKKLNRN